MEIFCWKFGQWMEEVCLNTYEFEAGFPLKNVKAMRCPKGHVTNAEEQSLGVEKRSEDLK